MFDKNEHNPIFHDPNLLLEISKHFEKYTDIVQLSQVDTTIHKHLRFNLFNTELTQLSKDIPNVCNNLFKIRLKKNVVIGLKYLYVAIIYSCICQLDFDSFLYMTIKLSFLSGCLLNLDILDKHAKKLELHPIIDDLITIAPKIALLNGGLGFVIGYSIRLQPKYFDLVHMNSPFLPACLNGLYSVIPALASTMIFSSIISAPLSYFSGTYKKIEDEMQSQLSNLMAK